MEIKLLILDVDGVLTDGTKVYDADHNVISKRFMCKDFTAIKRFMAHGIKVVFLSGDNFNRTMAEKRNIDFYCSRNNDLSLDKARYLDIFEKKYMIPKSEMAFVGDDFFDLSMFKECKTTFVTADAPMIVKQGASYHLHSRGGEGVIRELYDLFIMKNWLKEDFDHADKVAALDKQELTSQEMS